MPAPRRRVLSLLPRLGLRVTDIAPGVHLVTQPKSLRRNAMDVQKGLNGFLASQHIAWILRKYRVNCVIDVGANRGQFAGSLRASGYRGRIASFEPLPRLVDELERVARKDRRWLVYPYALGKEDTTTEMTVVSGTMSSILPPSDYGSRRYKRFGNRSNEDVPVRRLDGLLDGILAGIPRPRPFLKLDTQGYDLEAFAGLGDRSAELVGLQSEMALLEIYAGMPRMTQAIETYEAAGFEITGMFPVTREEDTARVLEFDCVMVRSHAE